jgi:hypothetical protein
LSNDFIEVVSKFERLNASDYPDVEKYESPLDAGLWALWVYKDKLRLNDYLNADQISELLRARGVSIKELKLSKAFARAGAKIDAKSEANKTAYKIMNKGIDYLRSKEGKGNVEVFLIEGDKPRRSHQYLKDVVAKTKGELKILDKYYGLTTLDLLEKIDKKTKVKFLTASLGGNEDAAKFARQLPHFEKEYPNIELKKYPNSKELHDRYIITSDTLILLGHGLKDLGGKESFVLVFKDEVGQDIRTALSAKFDEKWSNASKLT